MRSELLRRAAPDQALVQVPDLAHWRREAARDGGAAALFGHHFRGGFVHGCGQGQLCAFLQLAQAALQRWPQQRGIQEGRRHRLALRNALVAVAQRVHDQVAFFGRFAQRPRGLRENRLEQPEVVHDRERRRTLPSQQQLQHLVEHARRGDLREKLVALRDGGQRGLFDGEIEFRGKTCRAQHAHRVFAEARHRVADHAKYARFEICHAGAEIQNAVGVRIVIQAVDAEVAPQGVFFDVAEDVVAQQHARFGIGCAAFRRLLVLAVGLELGAVMAAEGRYLDHLAP